MSVLSTILSFMVGNSDKPDVAKDEDNPMASKDIEEAFETSVSKVIPPENHKPNAFCAAAKTTISGHKYTVITVTKAMLVEDPGGIGSLLPSLFKVRFPSCVSKSIGFFRRANSLVYNQDASMNGLCYSVIAAPVEKSVELTVETVLKKQARAVFIVQGMTLLYRLEVASINKDTDTVNVEHVTYDVSSLLQYYAPTTSTNSVSYY